MISLRAACTLATKCMLAVLCMGSEAIGAAYAGTGWGTLDCTQGIVQLDQHPDRALEWAKGYMSGINNARMGVSGEFNDLGGLENAWLRDELVRLCHDQPDFPMEIVVQHIYRSLPQRQLQ